MPCSFALRSALVPARKWETRVDLIRVLDSGYRHLLDAPLDRVHLESAAHAAGLSPFHFQRLFLAVYGRTPHQVVAGRRLEMVIFLLQNTKLPIWRVAKEVGLAGAPALNRLTRVNFGATPGMLRSGLARRC
jgi:AraC family transcriptional regulator